VSAWLVIGSDPQYGFYAGPAKPSSSLPDLSYPLLSSVGQLRRPLEASGGEASNIATELDNGDASLTTIAAGWLFSSATVYYLDGGTQATALSGTIQAVEISETVVLTIVG